MGSNLVLRNGLWFLAPRREPRYKSPSKQRRDNQRDIRHLERKRILDEAYHDQGLGNCPSPGEVDARSESTALAAITQDAAGKRYDVHVEPGDVLSDPKLRYQHPSLRFW